MRPERGDALLGLSLPWPVRTPLQSRARATVVKPVLGISGIILAEGEVSAAVSGFEITRERFANLVAATGGPRPRRRQRRHPLDHAQQRVLDGNIDPQIAEGDAARLAVMLGPGVPQPPA